MDATTPEPDETPVRPLRRVAVGLAGVGQLVVGYFTLTAIGLIGMPVWAALGLTVAWLAGVLGIVGLARWRPLFAPAVPVAGMALLWALVTVGDAWLGWTA